MQFLNFPNGLPSDLFTAILAFTDLSAKMALRRVNQSHKAIMDAPRTALSTDEKTLQAYTELFRKQAEYDYQYSQLSESKHGLCPWLVAAFTHKLCPLSLITHVFTNTLPGFKKIVDLQNARKTACYNLNENILKIKHHLPIMRLFGGKKGFEELPELPHRTDDLVISMDDMTAPVMRLSNDLFVIRMKNNDTEKYLIQPYLMTSTGAWVTLESRETVNALVGRRALEENRTSLSKDELKEACDTQSERDLVVVSSDGEKADEYSELYALIINKQIYNEDQTMFSVE